MGLWGLAIDYGTSYTAAAIARDTTVDLLYFNGVPRIPSLVLRHESGEILVGTTAENETLISPDRVLRAPKRRLGDRIVLVGDSPLSVVDAVAAVLRAVAEEASRQQGGGNPDRVVMTHPARWGSERLKALTAAAHGAGLPTPEFLAEPVAAAVHYLATGDDAVPVGDRVAVYDLGGGTFDTAVLERRSDGGFQIIAIGGNEYQGGEDFDEILYRHFGSLIAEDAPEAWEQLRHSEERPWRKANAEFRRDVRLLKEDLSTTNSRSVYVRYPVDRELRLTRTQLETLLEPGLTETLDELAATIERSGTRVEDLSAIYLVGGSSRIRILPQLVRQRFGRVDTRDDPKAVVALGAARWAASAPATAPAEQIPAHARPAGSPPSAGPLKVVVEDPVEPPPPALDGPEHPIGEHSDAGAPVPQAAVATPLPRSAVPGSGTSTAAVSPGADATRCPRCSRQRNGTARYCNGCGYDYTRVRRRLVLPDWRLPKLRRITDQKRAILLSGAGLVAVVAIGIALANGVAGLARSSPSPEPGAIWAADLDVGDCFNPIGEGSDDPDQVVLVDCDEPHEYEVFHEFELPARSSEYPEESALRTQAGRECGDAAEEYVGEPLADRDLEPYLLYPLEPAWVAGDRTLTCALYRADGRPLTVSQSAEAGN